MDVPELVSSEDYDSQKCKLEASVRWLLAQAYHNEDLPPPYRSPFTENSQGEFQLSASMVRGLTSAEIYCKACGNIFNDSTMNWQGHSPVIQALGRKGIYVVDVRESAVTDRLLQQDKPIKLGAHVALIDSLLKAYTAEVAAVERVVQAVRKFTTFSASSELPYGPEDALVFWLNKVGSVVQHRLEKQYQDTQENQQQRRLPVVNKLRPSEPPTVPVVEELCKDLNDGCILAVLISFYCPDAIKLHDIALKEAIGIADSLYNLQLVIEFCQQRPPSCPLHLSLNDLFYTHRDLTTNLLAFLAELFVLFELRPIDCVRDVAARNMNSAAKEIEDNRPMTAKALKSASRPDSMISQATKRSFQQAELTQANSSPDLNSPGQQGLPGPRIPLLPKRLQHRAGSLTDMAMDESDEDPMQAWADTPDGRRIAPVQGLGASSAVGSGDGALLANVSIDSEMSLDISSDSNINLDLEPTPRPQQRPPRAVGPIRGQRSGHREAMIDPHHPDYMELESVGGESTWGDSARSSKHENGGDSATQSPSERLIPAQLRPSKEKSNNHHTKEVESGEKYQKSSPSTPSRSAPRSLNVQKGYTSQNMGGNSSSDSTPSEDYKTPSVESVPLLGSQLSQPAEGEPDLQPSAFESYHSQQEHPPHSRATRAQGGGRSPPLTRPSAVVGRSSAFDRGKPAMASFTLHERHTPQSARAAGIPVIGTGGGGGGGGENSGHSTPVQQLLQHHHHRDSSPRSSSDGSDQELRKLHSDHKHKESREEDANTRSSFFLNNNSGEPDSGAEVPQRPASLHVPKPIKVESGSSRKQVKQSPITSFAALRNQQANGEVEAAFSGASAGGGGGSLRAQFQRAKSAGPEEKVAKRTTFGAMPNTTTWQENAKKAATTRPDNQDGEADSVQPLASELINIRMKLEESRRKIEDGKRQVEKQMSEQRQKLGKTAFMQVIKKTKDGKPIDSNKENEARKEHEPISTQRTGSSRLKSPVVSQRTRPNEQEEESPSLERASRQEPVRTQRSGSKEWESVGMQRDRSKEREPITPQRTRPGEMSHSGHSDVDFHLAASPEKARPVQRRHSDQRHTESPVRQRTPKADPSPVRSRPMSAYEDEYHSHRSRERSLSPDFAETGIVSTHQTPKPFSQKEIRETLDNVKQRMFAGPEAKPGDITFKKAPPKAMQTSMEELEGLTKLQELEALTKLQDSIRYDSSPPIASAPSPPVITPSPTPAKPTPQQPLKSNLDKVKNTSAEGYSTSLEKLNTSLTDLQGEIMRLSLQNEVKKRPGAVDSNSLSTAPATGSAYYLYNQSQETTAAMTQPSAFTQRPPTHYPTTAHPQPTYPYAPSVAPPPPHPIAPSFPPQYPPTAAPPQYFPPHHPQYQTSPHNMYQQQLGYPYTNQQPWAHQQQPPPPQQPQQQPPMPMQYPQASTFAPQYTNSLPSDGVVTSHMAPVSPSTGASTLTSLGGIPSSSLAGIPSGSPPKPTEDTSSSPSRQTPVPISRERSLSPVKKPSTAGAAPDSNGGEGDVAGTDDMEPMPREPAFHPPPEAEGDNEGFFIAFEDTGVKRAKPQLGKNRGAKKDTKEKKSPTSSSGASARSPTKHSTPARKESQSPIPDEILHPMPPAPLEPGVGFVIGEEQTPPLTEMELKKKKVVEQMMKRKQQSAKDREKTELKRQKKREQEQAKKEMQEMKKAEEAAKREQIYQEYLRKKEERENAEEDSRAGISPAKRREKKPVKPRPKSQPPSLLEDKYSASSASSQEDLRGGGMGGNKHGVLPPPPSMYGLHAGPLHSSSTSVSSPYQPSSRPGSAIDFRRMDQPDYGNLAYGGATHRRPPSPGPKLFVKPSSKSNRHIITNAIQHCCLAGTVNRNVMEKVLNEIAQAEATHFVILFRDAQQQYRGIYSYYPEKELIVKIHGVGPQKVTDKMLDRFYKYNSGSKNFTQIATTKHMSATIDAITLQSHMWAKKHTPAKKPTHGLY